MAASIIGSVKSGSTRKMFQVKWDSSSKDVYVAWGGWTHCGKANSASEAMNKAEAWLYNK